MTDEEIRQITLKALRKFVEELRRELQEYLLRTRNSGRNAVGGSAGEQADSRWGGST